MVSGGKEGDSTTPVFRKLLITSHLVPKLAEIKSHRAMRRRPRLIEQISAFYGQGGQEL